MNWARVEFNWATCWIVLFQLHPYAPYLLVQNLVDAIFICRVPNPDSVVAVHTPSGVFSARSLLPNQKGCFRGSRLVSLKETELLEESTLESDEFEPLSVAKCRVFKRLKNKVTCILSFYQNNSFSICSYKNKEKGKRKKKLLLC